MEVKRKRTKKRHILFLITYAIMLVFFLFNLANVKNFIGYLINILSPLIYGVVFAFLIGIMVNKFQKLNDLWIKNKKTNKYFSIFVSYIVVISIIVGLVFLIVPELSRSIQDIANKFPKFLTSTQNIVKDIPNKYQIDSNLFNKFTNEIYNWLGKAFIFLSDQLPNIIGYTFNFFNFVKDILFALVISVYILISKEHLIQQVKKAITVLFPENYSIKIMDTMTYSNKIFKGYVSGQIFLSVIVGLACYLLMLIFKFPYVLLTSTVILFTNMIPIVGPIIGGVIGTLIIMVNDPNKALWFLIMIIGIQQLESNLIGPKISGNSVGISGLWTLIAIIIGGGLFGMVGIVLAVPVMAVVYHLASDFINNNYNKKFDNYVSEQEQEPVTKDKLEKKQK